MYLTMTMDASFCMHGCKLLHELRMGVSFCMYVRMYDIFSFF